MKNPILLCGQTMPKYQILLVVLSLFFPLGITRDQSGTSNAISEPTLFAPNIISTGDYECVPEFTPDGQTLYFRQKHTGHELLDDCLLAP